MIRALACACLALHSLAFAAEWSRGIDQVAMGTFGPGARQVLGLSLVMNPPYGGRPGGWPTLGLGGSDLGFGEVRPIHEKGDGPVKAAALLSADWGTARHRFESAAGAIELWVSNLSPAVLIRSDSRKIALFAGSAPTRIAAQPPGWPYLLVTFHNAKGFKDGQIPAVHGTPPVIGVDAPVLVLLQNKPVRMELSGQGLELDFGEKAAGVVQVMPLFGVRKLQGKETAAWANGVPADVTERCQRFARMSRFYPVSCKEEFRLGADDSVSVRQTFDYLEIQDEWGTKGDKVAPLPPALGIALTFGKRFSLPVAVTPSFAEIPYFTPNGPLLVCPGDRHVVRFEGARKYVDEALEIAPGKDAVSRDALAKLNAQVEKILKCDKPFRFLSSSSNYQFFRFGAKNEQLFSLCQSLPLLRPELRGPVKAHARAMLGELLTEANFVKESVRTPAGVVPVLRPRSEKGLSGVWESEDLYNGLTLSAIWAYGHYTGDLDTVRPRRALLDAMANHVFTRHNWLLGFAAEGWATTGFCHTAQVDALVAYARLV